MEDIKILSPMQLWADFDPTERPLETSYVQAKDLGFAFVREQYISAFDAEDGVVRAYVRLILPKNPEKKCPVVVFIPTADVAKINTEFVKRIIEKGFAYCYFDYSGKLVGKERFTDYPKSLAYVEGSAGDAEKQIEFHQNPKKSPLYSYVKIARRVITFLTEDASVDSENIIFWGIKEGAEICWITAGIDNRVKAIVPVLDYGYTGYKPPKFSKKPMGDIDSGVMEYMSCLSSQAYAKTVNCPLLVAGTTNSTVADVDRMADIVELAPSEHKNMIVTPRAEENINAESVESILKFLDETVSGKWSETKMPELTYYFSEGRLYASTSVTGEVQKVEFFTSFDEVLSELRNWSDAQIPLRVSEKDYLLNVEVPSDTKLVFIFVNVTYKSGIVASSKVYCVDPNVPEFTAFVPLQYTKNRIIYSSTETRSVFNAEKSSISVASNVVAEEAGPFGIKGISSSTGYIASYKIGERKFQGEDGCILQIDCATKEQRTITFTMCTYDEDDGFTPYSVEKELPPSKKWQRLNFSASDFKNADHVSLKSWKSVKKFQITGAENVLFNNILWI